jgi:hypothetical protein
MQVCFQLIKSLHAHGRVALAPSQLATQMGHGAPDARKSTGRYIKFDKRHLTDAKTAIEDYFRHLASLAERDLLRPASPKTRERAKRSDLSIEQIRFLYQRLKGGGRDRDRTCDPYHVNGGVIQ